MAELHYGKIVIADRRFDLMQKGRAERQLQ